MTRLDPAPRGDPLETARRALEPGERLVWADRPDPRAFARTKLPSQIRGVLGLALIAVLHWYGLMPPWTGSLQSMLIYGFVVAAALFCVLLITIPSLARISARSMVYAVTDRRVICLGFWPFRLSRVFTAAQLDNPRVIANEQGWGSVLFVERKLPWWQHSAGGSYQIEGFYGVADAPQVAEAIERVIGGGDAADQTADE